MSDEAAFSREILSTANKITVIRKTCLLQKFKTRDGLAQLVLRVIQVRKVIHHNVNPEVHPEVHPEVPKQQS